METLKVLGLKFCMNAIYILRGLFRAPYVFFNNVLRNLADSYVKLRPNERNDISRRFW